MCRLTGLVPSLEFDPVNFGYHFAPPNCELIRVPATIHKLFSGALEGLL